LDFTKGAIRIVHQHYDLWQKINGELKCLSNRIGRRGRHPIEKALARKVPHPVVAKPNRSDATAQSGAQLWR
jgi:hypothetical protein